MIETLEHRIESLEKHLAEQPRSPLFAQLAGYYLEAGRSQDALTVCDSGLAHYPFYSTGHLIKGRTLLALNMRAEARRELEFVHQMLPLNEAVAQLVAQIPPSPEESLTSAPAAVKAPAIEPAPESAPVEPAVSDAEQVLSQFTEETVQPAAEGPVIAPEPPPQEEASPFESLSPEAAETPAETTDPFGLATPTAEPETFAAPEPGGQTSDSSAELAGAFAAFSEQKRGELFGLENTISLDEYFQEGIASPPEPAPVVEESSPVETPEAPAEEIPTDPFAALTSYADTAEPPTPITPAPPAAESTDDPFAQLSQNQQDTPKDQIEEIAEKLKEARRITPVINLADRSSATPSEADTPSETGFVTPTLAEIYAKQGWYDDAIKAYKTLAVNKPTERDKYESRIRELEDLKKQQMNP